MGALASLSLDDAYDVRILFLALLDAGNTVRDMVCLGLTCRGARAWVCTMVSLLSAPVLHQLVQSMPPIQAHMLVDVDGEWRGYTGLRELVNNPSPFAWRDGYEKPRQVFLVRKKYDTRNDESWKEYTTKKQLLSAFAEVPFNVAPGRYPWESDSKYEQWYPMLDVALNVCLRRLKQEQRDAERAEMAARAHEVEDMRTRAFIVLSPR